MPEYDYDLLVIGSGPAGQRAAIQAAKLNKRVVIVERRAVIGGVCTNTGTIPSKTLREAVLHLSGFRERGFYGDSYSVKQNITLQDLLFRTDQVIRHEIDVTRSQLQRNRVEVLEAVASFVDAHTVRLAYVDGRGFRDVHAQFVVIAVGTTATQDPKIPFDGRQIFVSDDILRLDKLPRTLTVVGAGVIGCEYASIFSTLGVRVTLVDQRNRLLPFVDAEIADALSYHMRENRVTLRLGETVSHMEPVHDENGERVRIVLTSGKQIITEKALHSIGRTGATDSLNLEAAGLAGFPSLASTSMEQGRLATCHAFGVEANSVPELFPYGIYTIPEISMVGRTEQELTELGVPYEVGKANYKEIARGQIIGDSTGLLKLLFHQEKRNLLGVHIIGEGASELVHIGQAVLAFGGRIDYFVQTVFNYPTLAECYKTAAFDGINRLGL